MAGCGSGDIEQDQSPHRTTILQLHHGSRGSAPQEMSAWTAPPEMGCGLSKNNERNHLNKTLFIIIRKKDFCVIIK
jgi:hypothetical protein